MKRIEVSRKINCPVEKAFAYSTDSTKWNTWMAFIPEAEQTSPGPVGVGTTFRGSTRLMGRTMPWTSTATEYQPPNTFGKNITSGSVFIEQHNTYQTIATGTNVTIIYDLTVGGLMKLMEPFMIRSLREGLEKSLSNLQHILEK
jgi:uncharacterized protein YndB with AHSA1/START domain